MSVSFYQTIFAAARYKFSTESNPRMANIADMKKQDMYSHRIDLKRPRAESLKRRVEEEIIKEKIKRIRLEWYLSVLLQEKKYLTRRKASSEHNAFHKDASVHKRSDGHSGLHFQDQIYQGLTALCVATDLTVSTSPTTTTRPFSSASPPNTSHPSSPPRPGNHNSAVVGSIHPESQNEPASNSPSTGSLECQAEWPFLSLTSNCKSHTCC